ncbi:MAG: sigma-70 family RNA polymerase sigma factor [Gemmataceae bacterium]
MPDSPLDPVVRHLHRLAHGPDVDRPDTDLLRRFAAANDAAAFEQIVRRHGPTVWGVCARQLRDRHAAEDAFQATFLVLARRAAAVRKPAALGPWLYGVALRVAGKLRARRPPPLATTEPVTATTPLMDASAREVAAALDEELARLPDRLRAPLVLCYLDGRTRDEAAADLGWSLGTLKRRLEQGKAVLHARLTRRGVGLPLAALTAALAETGADAAVPAPLYSATGTAAAAFADGTLGPTPPALLAKGVLTAMSWSPAKLAAAVLVAGTLSASVGLAVRSPAPDDPAPKPPAPVVARADRFGDPLPDGAAARLGTMRWRAGARVDQVAFSRDGSLAVGGTSHGVQFWDAATGRPLDRPAFDHLGFEREGRQTMNAVALSPDGKLLATGSRGLWPDVSTVRLWDMTSGFQVPSEKQDVSIQELTFGPDGKTLAGRPPSGFYVWLWEVPTGRRIGKLGPDIKFPISSSPWLAYAPDGKTLYTAAYPRSEITAWDTATGQQLRTVPIPRVLFDRGFALSPDGGTLALGCANGVVLLDAATGRETGRFPVKRPGYYALEYLHGGKVLVGRTPKAVDFLDPATGKVLATRPTPQANVGGSLYVSPTGSRVVLASQGRHGVWVWDAAGAELGEPAENLAPIADLAIADGGKTLVAAPRDGDSRIRYWDVATRQESPAPEVSFAASALVRSRAVALSPDGRFLASAETKALQGRGDVGPQQQLIGVIELRRGSVARTFDNPHSTGQAVAWSPDGATLAANAPNGGVRLWAVKTGREDGTLAGESQAVADLAFTPDGRTLAVAYYIPAALWLWDVSARKVVQRLSPGEANWSAVAACLAFTSDGKTLAAGDLRGQVRQWDTTTGTERPAFAGPKAGVTKCAYTPDGKRLIAGGADGSVWAWDATGRVVRQLTGHRHAVTSLALTPDGKTLATGKRGHHRAAVGRRRVAMRSRASLPA